MAKIVGFIKLQVPAGRRIRRLLIGLAPSSSAVSTSWSSAKRSTQIPGHGTWHADSG